MILNSDRKMYYLDADQPFECHTTNLNEDLGQVRADVCVFIRGCEGPTFSRN